MGRVLVGLQWRIEQASSPAPDCRCGSPSSGYFAHCSPLVLTGFQGGRLTLVFGCRHPQEDHLYQEEMLQMARKGVLHEVHTAYSRLPGQPKVNADKAGGPLETAWPSAQRPQHRSHVVPLLPCSFPGGTNWGHMLG